MSSRPRHHSPDWWANGRGDDIRLATRAVVRLLDAEAHQREWHDGNWRHRQRRSRSPRSGPRPFITPPHDCHSKEHSGRTDGDRISAEIRDGEENWNEFPWSNPAPRLEAPGAAEERSSCDSNQSPPTVPAGVVGGEGVSWE